MDVGKQQQQQQPKKPHTEQSANHGSWHLPDLGSNVASAINRYVTWGKLLKRWCQFLFFKRGYENIPQEPVQGGEWNKSCEM